MKKQHFTIGLAGHIDHGKTELVKALTNINTDRLKEEKERKISIELGYAPLFQTDEFNVAIIDVPGHEKFIRQMIAGVSSIDLTLLVIAANEGIMPQTLEHMDILKHLGIQNVMMVMTKINQADEDFIELVREDLSDTVKGTVFEQQPIFEVDSITKEGITELKQQILTHLFKLNTRSSNGTLFLPIDQSFHLHGIGTIVRGTVTTGGINENQTVYIMPQGLKTQVKSIHHFNEFVDSAVAGQRAAVALNNVNLSDAKRGTVITDYPQAKSTSRMDIELNVSFLLKSTIRQRSPVKLHTGTSEVYGKIIFFDRNKLELNEGVVYCQVVLDQPVYVLKDQRFILRRATPVEMIGGGKIIEPHAQKHRHHQETIDFLEQKALFDQEDYVLDLIDKNPGITKKMLGEQTTEEQLVLLLNKEAIINVDQFYYSNQFMIGLIEEVKKIVSQYHSEHPLLNGINKSELISRLFKSSKEGKAIMDYFVESALVEQIGSVIREKGYKVTLSAEQQKLIDHLLTHIKSDWLEVNPINTYLSDFNPNERHDLILHLVQQEYLVQLNDELYVERHVFENVISQLKANTNRLFELKEAKQILGLSRKFIIPFLEKLDKLNYTQRIENNRKWVSK